KAAPSLTDATKTLTPFSEATTVSLKSLAKAGEESGPLFAAADPVVKKAATLAKSGVHPTSELSKLLVNLQKTGGWGDLTELIYNTTAVINGFDQYGHFARARLKLSTCLEYIASPAGYSGCVARFNGFNAASPEEEGEAEAGTSATEMIQLLLDRIEGENE